jgi:hypothetical protein
MTFSRKLLATTCAGSLAMLLAMPISSSFAQSAGDSSSSMSAPNATNTAVDDATLQKAAKAYVQVKQITHAEKQSANASSGDVAQAEASKLQAVRSQGLQPEEYNHVIQMVENDNNLQQKFLGYVNQNGGDSN